MFVVAKWQLFYYSLKNKDDKCLLSAQFLFIYFYFLFVFFKHPNPGSKQIHI